MIDEITVPYFFDAHVHFRQGADLPCHVAQTARCCDRAIAMPNTKPPLIHVSDLSRYHGALVEVSTGTALVPLVTLYLTPRTTPATIEVAKLTLGSALVGAKIYPAGATTGSDDGIPYEWLEAPPPQFVAVLKALARHGVAVNVHGECPHAHLVVREQAFLDTVFLWRAAELGCRVVLEHVSTIQGAEYIWALRRTGLPVACTITLHHLFDTLDDAYGQVHNTCRPAPMQPRDRTHLVALARRAASEEWCFLGSDSAPHSDDAKYRPVAACGCYTAPVLAEKLAEVFADDDGTDRARAEVNMVAFTSTNAGAFYGAPPSGRRLTLVRHDHEIRRGDLPARPWRDGEPLRYRLVTN